MRGIPLSFALVLLCLTSLASAETYSVADSLAAAVFAAYIKKNIPDLSYAKATDANGNKIVPVYRITGTNHVVLW